MNCSFHTAASYSFTESDEDMPVDATFMFSSDSDENGSFESSLATPPGIRESALENDWQPSLDMDDLDLSCMETPDWDAIEREYEAQMEWKETMERHVHEQLDFIINLTHMNTVMAKQISNLGERITALEMIHAAVPVDIDLNK